MNSTNKVVALLVGLALMVAIVMIGGGGQNASAQYVESDLRQMLTDLWTRVLDNQSSETLSNFVFTISFESSIAGLGNSVTFGQDLTNLQLREAGENYFCIARRFSRTTNVDCIPYTNITKVSYSERD